MVINKEKNKTYVYRINISYTKYIVFDKRSVLYHKNKASAKVKLCYIKLKPLLKWYHNVFKVGMCPPLFMLNAV